MKTNSLHSHVTTMLRTATNYKVALDEGHLKGMTEIVLIKRIKIYFSNNKNVAVSFQLVLQLVCPSEKMI